METRDVKKMRETRKGKRTVDYRLKMHKNKTRKLRKRRRVGENEN